ncbi:MAG TPA: alpha-ketoglutarate-dependent dioxygenase AlkB [Mycobacteriales bacterium]|nr:alpha-ketoglutarate-dependent dioxygenase AlkB [Mycobacteriales bacterium]
MLQQLERTALDATSWVDLCRGWLDDPAEVYAALAGWDGWRQGQVWQYDHLRGENRLSGFLRPQDAPHPALIATHKALRRQYGVELTGLGLSWYRDGRDAMGAHRDSDLRHCESTLVAVLTLGATRPWLVRPNDRTSRAAPIDLAPASGDLLVMGGRAQADWLHGVPPVPGLREGRISVQWRWTSRTGRPETGGGSRAARRYGSGR